MKRVRFFETQCKHCATIVLHPFRYIVGEQNVPTSIDLYHGLSARPSVRPSPIVNYIS